MWRRPFQTRNDLALFILRVILGIVFLPHGAQKLLGLFGGPGLSGTIAMFEQMGIPKYLASMVIAAEFLGAIFLIVGFLTRLGALGIACVMSGAIWLVHFQNGFFMNWQNSQQGEGFEFHLLALAIALALMIRGGGWASVDRYIANPKHYKPL